MPVLYVRPPGVGRTPVTALAAVHVEPMNHWSLSGTTPGDVMVASMDAELPADSEMLVGSVTAGGVFTGKVIVLLVPADGGTEESVTLRQ